MAVPVINEDPGLFTVPSGVAFSTTFTATESPASWAVSGAPAGAVINDGTGVLTVTPTDIAVTAYTVSVTATNASGTSDAVSFVMLVQPAADGATTDDLAVEIDFDILTKKLRVPQVTDWLPAGEPGQEAPSDEGYLLSLTAEERFDVAVATVKRGVIQDPDITAVDVTIKEFDTDRAITLTSGALTEINDAALRRFKRKCFVDPALVESQLINGEGDLRSFFDAAMQVSLELANDDRDFSATLSTETITTLDQGDTHDDTHAITIDTEDTESRLYRAEVKLLTPSDPGLQVTLLRDFYLTYNGSAYVLGDLSGSTSGTGSSTVEADWDTTLSIQSLTATSTGISLGTRVTTTAYLTEAVQLVIPLEDYTISAGAIVAGASESWDIRDTFDNTIFTWSPSDGDEPADVEADFLSGASETVTVEFTDATNTVTISLPSGTSIATALYGGSTPQINAARTPLGPSYADASVTVQVTGQPMPENSERRISHSARVRVYREH